MECESRQSLNPFPQRPSLRLEATSAVEPLPRFCSVKLPWGLLLSTLGALQRPSRVFSLCSSYCSLNLKVKIQFLQCPPVFPLLHMVFNGVCSILQYNFHDDLGAKVFPGEQIAYCYNTSLRGKLFCRVRTNVGKFSRQVLVEQGLEG